MPYCTQDDILKLISAEMLLVLADDGEGEIDAAKVAAAIAAADATIDAYCQERFTVPLSPVPQKITQISVDIALYELYSGSDLEMPEVRKERNAAALRFLEKVAGGKISLGSTTPAPEDTENSANIESNDRIFTRDKMAGF